MEKKEKNQKKTEGLDERKPVKTSVGTMWMTELEEAYYLKNKEDMDSEFIDKMSVALR